MYRLLLAGAVLAGAYMDSLYRAREEGGKEGFFVRTGLQQYSVKHWAKIDPSESNGRSQRQILCIFVNPPYIIMPLQTGARSASGEIEATQISSDHSRPGSSKMEE
jgi:hypothetical protein